MILKRIITIQIRFNLTPSPFFLTIALDYNIQESMNLDRQHEHLKYFLSHFENVYGKVNQHLPHLS